MRDWGASPNVRHSTLIVTDERQILGYDGPDVLQWVPEKKRKEKNQRCFVDRGVAKHRLGALMAKPFPKTRG